MNAPAKDLSNPAARWMITETSCAAFRQSSRESRFPETNSTASACECWPITFLRFSSLLEGRTKHRRLVKPYSRRQSTTFAPIKPLAPVIRRHSSESTIYRELICRIKSKSHQNRFENNHRL